MLTTTTNVIPYPFSHELIHHSEVLERKNSVDEACRMANSDRYEKVVKAVSNLKKIWDTSQKHTQKRFKAGLYLCLGRLKHEGSARKP